MNDQINLDLLSRKHYPLDWDREPLLCIYKFIIGATRKHIPYLASLYDNQQQRYEKEHYFKVFGLDHEFHAFYATPLMWGINLTEPQITRSFVYFMNTVKADCFEEDPKEVFLRTLLGYLVKKDSENNGDVDNMIDLEVINEYPIRNNKRRIDILFRWNGGESKVVIECKINHTTTKDQLKDLPWQNSECVLLGRSSSNKIKNEVNDSDQWTLVSWESFLLRFEKALKAKCENEYVRQFQMFRRTVWQTIKGV